MSIDKGRGVSSRRVLGMFSSLKMGPKTGHQSVGTGRVSSRTLGVFSNSLSFTIIGLGNSGTSIRIHRDIPPPGVRSGRAPYGVITSRSNIIAGIRLCSNRRRVGTNSTILGNGLLVSKMGAGRSGARSLMRTTNGICTRIRGGVSSSFRGSRFYTPSHRGVECTLCFFGIGVPLKNIPSCKRRCTIDFLTSASGAILPVNVVEIHTARCGESFLLRSRDYHRLLSTGGCASLYEDRLGGYGVVSSSVRGGNSDLDKTCGYRGRVNIRDRVFIRGG